LCLQLGELCVKDPFTKKAAEHGHKKTR